jgi:hypothetical protein
MSVYAANRMGFHTDQISMTVRHEHVGGLLVPFLSAHLVIPPRTLHQWHLIDLCHSGPDPAQPWLALTPVFRVRAMGTAPPTDVYSRVVSAWCTAFDGTNLVSAIQTDRHVQYNADLPYDAAWDDLRTTNAQFQAFASRGAWPAGYADAAYFRLEAERAAGHGQGTPPLGIAQINIFAGPEVQEGSTTQDGTMAFREQAKGLTREGQQEAYGKVRLPIPRGAQEGLFFLQISTWARGMVLADGFELRAAMPEFAPTAPPPPPPSGDPVREAVLVFLPHLRTFNAAMQAEGL